MSIRYEPFSVENIADIVVLSMKLHEESAARDVPFDIEYTAQSVYEQIIQSDDGFGLLAMDDDHPVGMIIGKLAQYEFAPVTLGYNHVWYVEPERRGSPVAFRLLMAFEQWCMYRGVTHVHLGLAAGVLSERTARALGRFRYKFLGGNFAKVL